MKFFQMLTAMRYGRCFVLSGAIVLTACKHVNPTYPEKVGKIHSVVILGNSIVRHPPLPSIGWNNDWGMAASVPDSDFVHILSHCIATKHPGTTIRWQNIAEWERDYQHYNLQQLDSLKNPDMIILRVSENVTDSAFDKQAFTVYYDSLLNFIDPQHKAMRVLAGGFWERQANGAIKSYASHKNLPLIETRDLSNDTTNMAYQWQHPGIRIHPNDKGMRLIADRIWSYISQYF